MSGAWWAVAGVAFPPGGVGAEALHNRAVRIMRWARGVGQDATVSAETRRITAARGYDAGDLLRADLRAAERWLYVAGRRDRRPGPEVMSRIDHSPVTGVEAGVVTPVLSEAEVLVGAVALVREDATVFAGSGGLTWGEDVPWQGVEPVKDTGGLLALGVRGFLPDPGLVGVEKDWRGDWSRWLWLAEPWRGFGPTPPWVGEVPARSRLFLASREFGPWGLPLRVDLEMVEAYPPDRRVGAWLVRRGSDGTWWACWVVDA